MKKRVSSSDEFESSEDEYMKKLQQFSENKSVYSEFQKQIKINL